MGAVAAPIPLSKSVPATPVGTLTQSLDSILAVDGITDLPKLIPATSFQTPGFKPYLGQVATRCIVNSIIAPGVGNMMCGTAHRAMDNITSLRVALQNFYTQGGFNELTITGTSGNALLATNTLVAGAVVIFNYTGNGFTAGNYYYVISTGLSGSQFELSLTPGGAPITPTSSSANSAIASGLYGELGCGSNITVTASIEYPIGTQPKQIAFSGSASGTILNNSYVVAQAFIYSDFCQINIPKGKMFRIRAYYVNVSNPTTGSLCCSYRPSTTASISQLVPYDFVSISGGVDFTMTTAYPGTGQTGPIIFPLGIHSVTSNRSVFIMGDSRTYGPYDYISDGDFALGISERSVAKQCGYSMMATGGCGISYVCNRTINNQIVQFYYGNRLAQAQFHSTFYNGYGINDLNNGVTGANLLVYMQQFLTVAEATTGQTKEYVCITVSPDVMSLNGYATLAGMAPNQGVAQNAVLAAANGQPSNYGVVVSGYSYAATGVELQRITYNSYLTHGFGSFADRVIDICSVTEPWTNAGILIAPSSDISSTFYSQQILNVSGTGYFTLAQPGVGIYVQVTGWNVSTPAKILTPNTQGMAVGNLVVLPYAWGGISASTPYFVVAVGSGYFEISATYGGSAYAGYSGNNIPTQFVIMKTVSITGYAGSNILTANLNGLQVGDCVQFGASWGGFSAYTPYYVVAAVANTSFQLSATSGGSAITPTGGTSANVCMPSSGPVSTSASTAAFQTALGTTLGANFIVTGTLPSPTLVATAPGIQNTLQVVNVTGGISSITFNSGYYTHEGIHETNALLIKIAQSGIMDFNW